MWKVPFFNKISSGKGQDNEIIFKKTYLKEEETKSNRDNKCWGCNQITWLFPTSCISLTTSLDIVDSASQWLQLQLFQYSSINIIFKRSVQVTCNVLNFWWKDIHVK